MSNEIKYSRFTETGEVRRENTDLPYCVSYGCERYYYLEPTTLLLLLLNSCYISRAYLLQMMQIPFICAVANWEIVFFFCERIRHRYRITLMMHVPQGECQSRRRKSFQIFRDSMQGGNQKKLGCLPGRGVLRKIGILSPETCSTQEFVSALDFGIGTIE